jgi:hypothetical protein
MTGSKQSNRTLPQSVDTTTVSLQLVHNLEIIDESSIAIDAFGAAVVVVDAELSKEQAIREDALVPPLHGGHEF